MLLVGLPRVEDERTVLEPVYEDTLRRVLKFGPITRLSLKPLSLKSADAEPDKPIGQPALLCPLYANTHLGCSPFGNHGTKTLVVRW